MIEQLAIGAIVLIAACYCIWRVSRAMRRGPGDACGECSTCKGCAGAEKAPPRDRARQ